MICHLNKRRLIKQLSILIVPALVMTSCSGNSGEEGGVRPVNIAYTKAEIRDLSARREVTAPVIAYQRIYITARTSGQVLEVNYEEGDHVSKGDLLARLDTRRQQSQLRRAAASLQEVERSYYRSRQLFESEIIPPSEYETALRELEETRAEVEFWDVEVELGHIRSPIDAVVTSRLIEIGTTVAENQRMFTVEDHDLLVARPGLSERDVVHLEKGQQVDLEFDIYPDARPKGTIRRIFPAADGITRLFTVEIEIDQGSAPFRIYPGYLVRMNFLTDKRDGVVALPPEAIDYREDKTVVFLIDGDMVRERKIETGIRREGWIEVLSGLEGGEEVAAGDPGSLEDGTPVNIRGRFRRYGFRE